MPIHHAAFKQIKKDKKRTLRNKAVKSELKTYVKKFEELLAEKKLEEAKSYLRQLISKLHKAKSKGVIHKNTASRKISRLYQKLNKLSLPKDKTVD